MQALQALEEKIKVLLEHAQTLQQENDALTNKVALLESSILSETDRAQELNKEKELTKTVVDDLIKNIDALVEKR